MYKKIDLFSYWVYKLTQFVELRGVKRRKKTSCGVLS